MVLSQERKKNTTMTKQVTFKTYQELSAQRDEKLKILLSAAVVETFGNSARVLCSQEKEADYSVHVVKILSGNTQKDTGIPERISQKLGFALERSAEWLLKNYPSNSKAHAALHDYLVELGNR